MKNLRALQRSPPPFEKEAGAETTTLGVFACNHTSNSRLSYAGQPFQPVYGPLILPVGPSSYLVEKVDSGVG